MCNGCYCVSSLEANSSCKFLSLWDAAVNMLCGASISGMVNCWTLTMGVLMYIQISNLPNHIRGEFNLLCSPFNPSSKS
jgi:hypothetical protein